MPLAGILVQYSGWSSVFYIYGRLMTMRLGFWVFDFLTILVFSPLGCRLLWDFLVHVLDSGFI